MEKKFIKEYIEDLLNDERDLIIIFNEINAKFLNESLPLVAKELFFTLRFLCNEFMLFTIRKEIIEIERFILDLENRNLLEPIFVPESDYYIFEPFIFHIAEYEIFSNVTYNYPLTQQSPTDKKLIDFQKLYLKNPISNDFETPNLYDYKNRLKNAYYLCEYFQKKTNLEIDFNFDNYHLYKNYFTDNPLIHNPPENKNEDIFCYNGFELFEYLLEHFVKPKGKRGHHTDVLFCYHKLFNNTPKYIHQRTQPFLNWYNDKYEDDITQTKTFDEVKTDNRESLYSRTLELFKLPK